jgi:hypothetical protein
MGSGVMSDRVASGWKRKQVKKLVKQAERPRFRTKEMKGTGVSWGTQFHNEYNRSDTRLTKRIAKKHQ